MKTSTTSATVMLKAIDLELRAILLSDLFVFKTTKENKRGTLKKAA